MEQSKLCKWKYSLELLWMSPTPAKNDKLLAQKLSLISSCCYKENQARCQGKRTELALWQGMENARIYLWLVNFQNAGDLNVGDLGAGQ